METKKEKDIDYFSSDFANNFLADYNIDITNINQESEKFDTIICYHILEHIIDDQKAIAELYRVLKPDGKLLFAEHGISHESNVAKWQNRITPGWKKISGDCHLNRPIDKIIVEAKFEIVSIKRFYQENIPKIAGYIYLGEAKKLNL